MQYLKQWADRWRIPPQCLGELLAALGAGEPQVTQPAHAENSEAWLQSSVRLEEARRGNRLWRNNNGACEDTTGRVIRYGLANDSPAVSKVMKSSDLIGVTRHLITPADVGRVVGIFTALEIKRPGWHITPGDKRAQAQLNFIKLVTSLGGRAKFITCMEDLDRCV